MTRSPFTTERRPIDKATLDCPECGLDSHINGDWTIHVLVDSLIYECPKCDAMIDSRRVLKELTADSERSRYFEAKN